MLNTLTTIALVAQAIFSVLLILVILGQSGKEAGLSGALSGNSNSYLSKGNSHSVDAKLAAATKWFAAFYVILTVVVLVLLKLK